MLLWQSAALSWGYTGAEIREEEPTPKLFKQVILPCAHTEDLVVVAEDTSTLPLSYPTAAEPMLLLLAIPQVWLSMAHQEIIVRKYFTIPNYINFSIISHIFYLRQKKFHSQRNLISGL